MKQVRMKASLRMLALLLGLFLSAGAFAQNVIQGHVKDASGEPVIGATITVEGKAVGVTDFDGNFSVKAPAGAKVTFTYIGYTPQTVTASSNMNIIMQEDSKALNEVVVIGYGSMKKSDLTGSVTSVEADQLNKGLATSPADLLQGKAPGVVITTNSGAPGAGSKIRIRGGSSLSASNDPLIVVDGLPISGTDISGQSDVLSSINPNDIESFSVLKDASATAIYGSRASNGVILITTKKGSSGKIKVSVDATASMQTVAKKVDVMNADQLRSFLMGSSFGSNADAVAALGTASTNWQDQIYRTAYSEELNASVAGGWNPEGFDLSMPYRVSAGFLNNDGTIDTSSMKRGTVSFNLNPKFFKEHLSVNLNAKGIYTRNNFVDEGAISAAVHYDPTKPVYDTNGIHGYTAWMTNGSSNTMSTLNPVALLNEEDKTSNVRRFIGNAQLDYKFFYIPGLRANLNVGLDISSSNGKNIWLEGSEVSLHDKTQNGTGQRERYGQLRRDQTLEFYLDYARDLKDLNSRFDIMAGYSWQHFYNKTTNSKTSYDGETDFGVSKPLYKTESYLVSFYGRLNYVLMDRYYLTFTLRDDGTSRFQNNKWGLFPALAFGWRISDEKKFREIEWISNLKLRLGWGVTGQQNITYAGISPDYPSVPTYHVNQAGSYYQFGNNVVVPITALGYASDIKWESTTTWNVGLDYGFLDGRINGSIDWYYRKTKDLLNYVPVSAGSNLTNYLLRNVGNLTNQGVEVSLNVVPVQTKDWRWEVGLNMSYNHNEITKLTASDDPTYKGVDTGGISGAVGNYAQVHQVGHPAYSFYVFQQVYDADGHPIEGVYVDRNADGIINNDDRYIYKKPDADVTFGFNTELSWKKFTLSAALRANLGNYVYNNVASNSEMMADLWTNNFISNRVTSAVFSKFSNAQYRSDYYIQNASFLKLDRVTLAYQVTNWLRLNLTGQNLFTITNYDGVDPEVANGIDDNMYPRSRTFLLGASINF